LNRLLYSCAAFHSNMERLYLWLHC